MTQLRIAFMTALLALSMVVVAAPAGADGHTVSWDFSSGLRGLTDDPVREIAQLSVTAPAESECTATLYEQNGESIHLGMNLTVVLNGAFLTGLEGIEDESGQSDEISEGFVASGSDLLVVVLESTQGEDVTSHQGRLTVSCEPPPPPPPPPPGDEGCTPGYWKQPHHAFAWEVPQDTLISEVFGDTIGYGDKTLYEGLRLKGNKDGQALVRHAVAGYLNAISGDVDYFWTENQVKEAAAAGLKGALEDANEAGCPLGNGR